MSQHGRTTAKKGRSPDGAHFSQIPSANIPRSAFNRSCGLKTTFDSGFLVPIFCDEALPGDTMSLSVATFARMSTLLHPIMENQYLEMFFFAVPMRLLWDNWEKFNGEQTDPGDSTNFLIPTTVAPVGGYPVLSLSDYIGIPPLVPDVVHSVMWHRAYNLIYNEWFRDENLQDSVATNTGDGPDAETDYVLLRRGKRHDYFTSCLPFPQKGAAVVLPLGTVAPVVATGDKIPIFDAVAGGNPRNLEDLGAGSDARFSISGPGGANAMLWVDPKLETDLTAATAATINQIREAFQIQRLFERDARGGTRYTEIIRSHFGVVSPDMRLQRPEYLGGGQATIMVNTVAATSGTVTPIGDLAAYATAATVGRGFMKSFTEHCVIIGLACIRADLNYQQGLERQFSRSTRFDFYWPAFSHLGEQAVLNQEIFLQDPAGPDNLAVFGYQERYAEYRYKPSLITGHMRSAAPLSLDTWHLAQDFAALPVLNAAFIVEDPPVARVVAAPTLPDWLFDAWFSYKCVRPMPVYSVPGMVDHF